MAAAPRTLLYLVALAVLLKSAFFLKVVTEQIEAPLGVTRASVWVPKALAFGDPEEYYNLGKDLYENGRLDSSTRPILYPLVYAVAVGALGRFAPEGMVVVNYALSILTGLMLFGTVRRTTGSEQSGILAFSLYSLNPILTLYESSTFSEPLFLMLCTLGATSYLSQRLVLTGLAFALASLVRPQAVALYAVLVLFEVFRGRSRRALIVSVFLFAAIVGPWVLRFHSKYGQYSLSNIGQFNIGLYQANLVYAEAHGLEITAGRKEWLMYVYRSGGFQGKYPPPDLSHLDDNAAYWPYRKYPEITAYAAREALRLYARHPGVTLKYVVTGLLLTAVNPASGPVSAFFGYPQSNLQRDKVVDSLLRLDLAGLRASGALAYLNWTAAISAIYLSMSLVLFAHLGRRLVRRQINIPAFMLFAASWLVAGFAGVGAARFFVGGYALLILAALVPPRADTEPAPVDTANTFAR